MIDNARALELIERAERETAFCEHCDAPTVPAWHEGALWLECPSLERRRPLLQRLMTLDIAALHTRRLIAEADRLAAA